MVNIRSNVSITSTSFFPSSATMTTNITESFAGDADFQSIAVAAGDSAVVFEPTGIGSVPSTTFLYIQSPATNVGGFTINLLGVAATPVTLATMLPKDFICLPLAVTTQGISVEAVNLSGAAGGTVNVFWGVR